MNQMQTYKRWAGAAMVIGLLLMQSSLVAAQDITGEWEMTMEFGSRPSYATLSISKNADGTLAGKWGSNELSNVRFQDGKLSFVRTIRFGDQSFSMNYNGTLENGKLMGLMSSERGEYPANGARKKPMCPALGQWDISYSIRDRNVTGKLVVSEKPDGALDGTWVSERGGTEISNVKFRNGTLTFDRKSTFNERTYESTFEGTIKGNELNGTFKSQRGEMAAAGKRIGAPLIGKWELTSTSERGTRTRILTVFGDLTGRYESFGGEIPVKDLKLEGNEVTFAVEMGFGDRASESQFKGTMDGETLKGQMTSSRGTREVTGKKMAAASAVAGTWELTSESSQGGTRTSTLKITDGMTATYTSRDRETAVTDLKIDGNQISFKITRTFNDRQFTMEFKGTVTGTTLTGEFITSRGSRPVTGKKTD